MTTRAQSPFLSYAGPCPVPLGASTATRRTVYKTPFKRPFPQTIPNKAETSGKALDSRGAEERGRAAPSTHRAPGNPSPAAAAAATARCLARWPSRARQCSRPRAARSPARPRRPHRSPPSPSPPPRRRPRPRPQARRSVPSRSARCSGRRSPRLRLPSRPPWPRHRQGQS